MQVDRVVCRGRRTGEESCRPKMRLGGAIEASHRPWGALRRSFATLASPNRAEIAPRTGTIGKVTSLPFSRSNPDLKRVTHCRKKSRNRCRLPCCQIDNEVPNRQRRAMAVWVTVALHAKWLERRDVAAIDMPMLDGGDLPHEIRPNAVDGMRRGREA